MLVVVDRFSKLVKYLAYTKDIDAIVLAELFYRKIVYEIGAPDDIILDRGSVFISTY